MDRQNGMLTVVVPAYNEAELVAQAAAAIGGVLDAAGIPWELVFVDDGSTDGTWERIEAEHQREGRVRGVSFSRNFGKEAAIFAGLCEAAGDCCAVIDCDLQHPPEALPHMYGLWLQGYQVIEGKKVSRGKEGWLHKIGARCFYFVISKVTGVDLSRASDFKLLDRQAVEALLSTPEQHLFFRALSGWIGFPTASVDFEVQPRQTGQSKWSGFSLARYAIRNVASFSTMPMQIVTVFGIAMAVFSVILGIQTLVKWAMGTALEGFTTVILLILMSSSLLLLGLGIVGYYIARIYDEVRGRPKYILARRTPDEEES